MTQLEIAPEDALIPPQNLEAEESILGAMMLSPNACDTAGELVEPDDFYRASHSIIYRAACEVHSTAPGSVDIITLTDHLDKKGVLDEAGGRVRLHELAALVPATANVAHYCRVVKEVAVARKLIRAGGQISQLGWTRSGDADELLGKAETYLQRVTTGATSTEFESLNADLDDLFSEISTAFETGQPLMGLRTDYFDLDDVLSGLHGGQLILIAARPGMGKSALGVNIAENVAMRNEHAGVLSLEMSRREIQLRSLSRAGRVDSKKLRQGRMTPDEFERARQAKARVDSFAPFLHVEDNVATTVSRLRAQAKRLARQHDLKLLVVDYLQLLATADEKENRTQEISAMSRGLKLLARELNIPVIALSQLNRNLEGRADRRPILSDLRESGSLEQDADVVLFIYRDDYYNADTDPAMQGIAEVIVAKNRMGPQETVKLTYTKQTTTFKNLARGAA